MEATLNETGWRGSHEGWLEAAYQALLESGVDSVKILPLAKKLNLSRTSFYWFFRDREELLAALIARWREKNTGSIVRQSEAYAETLAEAMLNVFDCWLDSALFDSRFEFAVRSWALQSDEILEEERKADEMRMAALSRMFVSATVKTPQMCVRGPPISCRSVISPCSPRKMWRCGCKGFRTISPSIPARCRSRANLTGFTRDTDTGRVRGPDAAGRYIA